MRKEWEESQKSNPVSSIMGGGQSGASNFDMAAFLAGSSSSADNTNNGDGAGSGGSKREKGGRK